MDDALDHEALRINPDWARLPLFDRNGWERVRFGDVVANVNETERDPGTAGIERFIGLEHLEPGSLHIRHWGNVGDGTTFTRRCRPGQVLFGKRRAYQRKVALAEFDSLVSGDIYVLTPKNDRLLPELLAFLCMAERFFQHACGTSAGSLSPRTNWSSLASFEFDLPPLDQQFRIANILWATDDVQEADETTVAAAIVSERAFCANCFGEFARRNKTVRLGEISEFITSGSRGWAEHYSDKGPLFLRSQNIRDQTLDFTDLQRVQPPKGAEGERTRTKPGDLVITITGNSVGNVAFVPESLEEAYVSQHVGLVRLVQPERHRMLSAFFGKNAPGNEQILRAQYGLKPGLNLTSLRNLVVPYPDLDELQRITESIFAFDKLRRATQQSLSAIATMKRELCDALFNST
ncbi:MAG: hypothetical protein GEV05_28765 [Betaproteobacteria bacterium]|nr:hypothetical protein [Betaproteobacteria bacterium]